MKSRRDNLTPGVLVRKEISDRGNYGGAQTDGRHQSRATSRRLVSLKNEYNLVYPGRFSDWVTSRGFIREKLGSEGGRWGSPKDDDQSTVQKPCFLLAGVIPG